jgi:CheY-like chemotaxis protein
MHEDSALEDHKTLIPNEVTVLVVDDEEIVRQVITRLLEASGFNFLEAENGMRALEVVSQYDSRIDLILTDLSMPKMGGKELAERLKGTYPDLTVIFMSGFSLSKSGELASEEIAALPNQFLQKPFRAHELLSAIERALRSR